MQEKVYSGLVFLSMFLLQNGHSKSSFDCKSTKSHTNHNNSTEAVTISAVMHCVPLLLFLLLLSIYFK